MLLGFEDWANRLKSITSVHKHECLQEINGKMILMTISLLSLYGA